MDGKKENDHEKNRNVTPEVEDKGFTAPCAAAESAPAIRSTPRLCSPREPSRFMRSHSIVRHEYDDEFEEIWKMYARGSKWRSFRYWKNLGLEDKEKLRKHMPFYLATRGRVFAMHFERYIMERAFEDPVYDESGLVYDPENLHVHGESEIQAAINLLEDNGYAIRKRDDWECGKKNQRD